MLLKNLLKNKITSFFLIFAFSLSSISLVISQTIINNQKKSLKKYDKKFNKELLIDSKEKLEINEIKNLLENENIRLELKFIDDLNKITISTLLVDNYLNYEKISKGTKFSSNELNTYPDSILISTLLNNNQEKISFIHNENLKDLYIQGIFEDLGKSIIVSLEKFKKIIDTDKINDIYLTVLLSGEPTDIDSSINKLKNFLMKKDSTSTLYVYDFIKEDRLRESKIYQNLSLNIILITILNSIGITSLWITKRKKEFAIRKTLGSTNFQLMLLYFKELLLINFISMLISLFLYYFITKSTNGFIGIFSLEFNLIAYIQSFFIMIITSYIISIPSLFYLNSLNLNILLKE